jgi:peroxiredoxin
MRYTRFASLLFPMLLAWSVGCAPSVTENSQPNTNIDSQYLNNISTLYGHGGKVYTDTTKMRVASDFSWRDSLGRLHSLSELRGQVVVLNFWATWCTFCLYESPDLESASEDMLADSVHVIGISVDQGDNIWSKVKDFVDYYKLRYQIVIDPKAYTYFNYGVRDALPTTYVIDRTGHIAIELIGQQSKKKFIDAVNSIL